MDTTTTAAAAPTAEKKKHSPLDSTHPVMVPFCQELFYDAPSFKSYISSLPIKARDRQAKPATVEDATEAVSGMTVNPHRTANNDVTNLTAGSPLVDLFHDLTRNISTEGLTMLLDEAWDNDPVVTLKIMWNARSIHAGKSERALWYRCMGWLAEYHPRTLLENLQWIVRPVMHKKMKKEQEEGTDVGGEAMVIDKKELDDENDPTRYDVRNGVSHGYYRDLGNLLVLAVKGKLDSEVDPKEVLQIPLQKSDQESNRQKKLKRKWLEKRVKTTKRHKPSEDKIFNDGNEKTEKEEQKKQRDVEAPNPEDTNTLANNTKQGASKRRHKSEAESQVNLLERFNDENNAFYKALHLTIARIFADQLLRDSKLLGANRMKQHREISIAAKWAPSLEKMIDRSTLLASSISEIMFPPESIGMSAEPREEYLKQARQHYRMRISKLRSILDVVERKITAKDYDNIDFSSIPSLAMNRYQELINKNAPGKFEKYLNDVALGKASISGAVMMPSELVSTVTHARINRTPKNRVAVKVANGQWNSLLQRIKDSGTLENCISVCDVSASMESVVGKGPVTAMDSAIGLSLIVASVAKEPFNNRFITFSEHPKILTIDPSKSFSEQVQSMVDAPDWGFNTNFVAVFEDLILATATMHKIPPENMVKRIFVFSDMEFDQADQAGYKSSYEVIKEKYAKAGYEMPELVFWNLTGGTNHINDYENQRPKSKPVTKDDTGTCLVSGYSQALLKVFMDGGGFDEVEEEEEDELIEIEVAEDGEPTTVKKEKKKMDPLSVVKKATSGPAYEMLKVVD